MNILVTGSSGFLGRSLISLLISNGLKVRASTRTDEKDLSGKIDYYSINGIDADTKWKNGLEGINTVIHCAARAHIMQDKSIDPLAEFRKVNTAGTLKLARDASACGVKRFIFISSIKVNGEFTELGNPFTSDDKNIPTDPYGLSKYEAEESLKQLAIESGMEVVIIRPPLIYGPNVKANFRSMLKWVNRGVPLPFGAVNNKRSLVALTNLVDFINVCVSHPKAANETFLISDNEDVSTTKLLKKIAEAFNKKAMLVPIPVIVMRFLASLFGRRDLANRIFGNLQVDSNKTLELLGWKPIITIEQELKKTVETYLNEKIV